MPSITLNKVNSVAVDTHVRQAEPSTSFGTTSFIDVGQSSSSGTIRRALLKFDLGLIPNDAIINSATLTLVQTSANMTHTINVHKVTSAWDGNTTWNTQPSYDSASVSSLSVNTTLAEKYFDVKSLVQSWVNGTQNNGLILVDANESTLNTQSGFGSFEHGTTANQPTLTIDYTIPTTGKKQVEVVSTVSEYFGTGNKITPALPAFQPGDLVAYFVYINNNPTGFVTPAGWTKLWDDVDVGPLRHMVFTRTMQAGDVAPTFDSGAAAGTNYTWVVGKAVFRNVKAIHTYNSKIMPNGSTVYAPNVLNVSADKILAVVYTSATTGAQQFSNTLNYQEAFDTTPGNAMSHQLKYSYLHTKRTQAVTDMQSTSGAGYGTSGVIALEPLTNNPPTLTLTSPADNQTMAEGNTMQVQGSATDNDSGNVVTVKYKINNGTARAAQSGVSDGSTPISFAKTLTYSDKRIREGATDVTGVDLAENTDHTLTVWSEDDQGGKSAEVTRTFRVVWNRPPSISGSDTNLGTISAIPSANYSVTEPESDTFTITELLNGQQIRSFAGVAGQQYTATISSDAWLKLALGVQHELRIRATDSKGQFADRIYTFTRSETQIQFDLKDPFLCDAQPTRVLVTLDGTFPDGSTLLVEVCNNAFDATPTWEDATGPAKAGRGYIFANASKTATNWGINIRITINKGTATEKVILNGFGGAFD